MNTYEIRITNKDDDNDFCTEEVQSTSLNAISSIVQEAISFKETELEFEYNGKYIVIFEGLEEGYMYDIFASKQARDECEDSLDGGQCTSTLSNAIEMALSQA